MADHMDENESKEQRFELSAENELHFEVEPDETVILELKSGLAEIFGSELIHSKKYVFKSRVRACVFTWSGCVLTTRGKLRSSYIGKDSPMVIYANIHAALEQMRQLAEQKGSKGPNVLVAGPIDVGKSTMCRILLNYAVRQGRNPTFIDLDVGQGDVSIPGTICAVHMDKTTDIEDGFMERNNNVYHFGYKSPGHEISLYNIMVSHLANNINMRNSKNAVASASGVIINTCGWVKGSGYRSITNAIKDFEVDVILVLGMEGLFHQIIRDVPRFVKVIYVPRFKAVVERSRSERCEERDKCISRYFYGQSKRLQPSVFKVAFSDLKIYRVGRFDHATQDLPTGTRYFEHGVCLIPVTIGFHLLNHILTVTHTPDLTEKTIYDNVAGFICVNQVAVADEELTVTSPQIPPLPNVILLLCDIIFSKEF